MMKKSKLKAVGLSLVSLFVLSACQGGQQTQEEADPVDVSALPIVVSNTDEPIEGGTLDVGMVTDSAFTNMLYLEFSSDTYDGQLMGPIREGIFSADENFGITDEGIVKMDLDIEGRSVTLRIQEEVRWSDGTDLTADDLIYSYEVLGHPDYPGVRFTEEVRNVVGIEEYHNGDVDSISGITKVDDQTITIEYKEVNPGHLQLGGGIWNGALPKHYLEHLEVSEMEASDEVRLQPVHYGPYVVETVIPGEAITYVPNEHYYGGTPNLENIRISVVPDTSIVEALKVQDYDIVLSMPTGNYDVYSVIPNYEYLGRLDYAYTYLGFKLGTLNEETGEVEPNESAKMANKNLRQAMGYALDNDGVAERFYHGLRSRGTTLIPPVFPVFHDESQLGFPQDKEKARELLAEAGYEDVTGDGFVEDPDGNELVINFASMSGGGDIAHPMTENYIQEWADVGLNVELATGRLIDFQSFYDKLKADDPEIDIFEAAWATGAEPSPGKFYGRNAAFNYTRYASEEHDELLQKINSKEAFDLEYRKTAFADWQSYANEQAYVIPTLYRNAILPVHNRVTGWDWNHHTENNWLTVGVTTESRD